MKLYFPVYTNHWEIWEEEEENLRIMYHSKIMFHPVICKWKERVGFYGNLYNGNTAFTTRSAAWDWVSKNYNEAWKFQFTDFKEVER